MAREDEIIRGKTPWEPLERLLKDYAEGEEGAAAEVVMEDGGRYDLPARVFFQTEEELADAESIALDLCSGSVLDIGAAAGRHALILQERGLDVSSVDISASLVELQKTRGVRNAFCADVLDPEWKTTTRWQTLLLLMNGIGLVGDLAGLDAFLLRAREMLAPDGTIVCDSCDLTRIADPEEMKRMMSRIERGQYFGETRQVIEYRGQQGAALPWLYVDYETLSAAAQQTGWASQIIFESGDGSYLAALRILEGSTRDI